MKIKNGFILSRVGDDMVAVATGELSGEFSNLIVLNSVGTFLWEKLSAEGGADAESLASAVLEEYEIDEKTARADISVFLDRLSAAGILES
ncbi:MAG: PqqD family protein [Eubacteriales bacterium]|jgi:hypothetical protein